MRIPSRCAVLSGIAICALVRAAWAVEIDGVQPAALDQPRINGYISLAPDGDPLSFDQIFNISAFFDTGASGIMLSSNTAGYLGIQTETLNQQDVLYGDVGVSGTDYFRVSHPLYVSLAPYHPSADIDNINTYSSVYTQHFGPLRTQIGPIGAEDDPLLGDLDVFGVPLMANRVVVMDPRPVNTFFDTMRTYVYNPGTPFNSASQDSDPGIPITTHQVKLSHAHFSRFTTITPDGAPGPALGDNPFIGPNPVAKLDPNPPADDTPGIKVSYNNLSAEGSWLLDTGAAASILSKAQAQQLGVSYDPNTIGTDAPTLLGVPLEEQFTLSIGGIGGVSKLAGFYLDSLLLRTMQGDVNNDLDENHFRFLHAPVLVGDITVQDPDTQQQLTLDGIFGMNFLVASAFVSEGDPFPSIDRLTFGRFDWIVYDHQAGTLGLTPTSNPGVQGQLNWFGSLFDLRSDWDIGYSANFITGLSPSTYEDGDHVHFGDVTVNTQVYVAEPVAPGSVTFENETFDYEISGAAIRGETGLIKTGAAGLTIRNQNTYSGPTDIRAGSVIFAAEQHIGPVNVHAGASASFQTRQCLAALNVKGTASFDATNQTLIVGQLQMIGDGVLDLIENDLLVKSGEIDDIQQAIRNAFAGGTWAGAGLTSAAAIAGRTGLGYAAGNDPALHLPGGLFNGEPIGADSVLVKFTYLGDADLDGDVDASDVAKWALNFTGELSSSAQATRVWTQGDWDYDGDVDASDVAKWALNFTGELSGGGLVIDAPGAPAQAIAALQAMGIVVVPEPRFWALSGVLTLLLLERARRGRQ